MHAKFWRRDSLRDLEWIAGRGDEADSENWNSAMERSKKLWQEQRKGVEGIAMKPDLVAVMDAALSKASWDVRKGQLENEAFTLCHGDFHPFNVMWMEAGRVVLYDWEMVSIGSPGQELGQYMMNVDVGIRQSLEKKLVKSYYDELITSGVDESDFAYKDLWKEYVSGGAGKWIFLLPVLIAFCPKPMAQWFCDQMTSFFQDHGLTEENAPQPRM
uniref:Aminoglycoside phosphotransferase domain-containing protein n=1 Tax=Pseudictyota dubia TaxID=2749911 RepID=A0A7R9VDX6_9STRA|mmetsp:Transcript_11578/g.22030  ORF Transcript_11578/g.22030 Transcript_11578/m.22030 type:complete len:215 (+) Transcript_11578:2-646(+)